MAVKTLAQIKADLRRIRSRGTGYRKDEATDVSTYTLIRDLVDSLESIIAAS